MIHQPVLVSEVVELLNPALKPGATFIDATLGAGGHSLALLKCNSDINLIGIEQDGRIIDEAQENLAEFSDHLQIIRDNFKNIGKIVEKNKIKDITGILADIGVSSLQLDDGQRGFSFNKDAPLDMRMDQRQELSAELIIKTWNEQKIADILWRYGEERQSQKIAKAISANRREINSTQDLAKVVEFIVPRNFKKSKIHPATKVFQALRIVVNDEIGVLEKFLKAAPDVLAVDGRLAIISFHSLEDRLVKRRFIELKQTGNFEVLTKSPVIATRQEVWENRRSRSAKLRVIQRLS